MQGFTIHGVPRWYSTALIASRRLGSMSRAALSDTQVPKCHIRQHFARGRCQCAVSAMNLSSCMTLIEETRSQMSNGANILLMRSARMTNRVYCMASLRTQKYLRPRYHRVKGLVREMGLGSIQKALLKVEGVHFQGRIQCPSAIGWTALSYSR